MRRMKDSGIEWIGEIPEEWAVSKVKYVCVFSPTSDLSHIKTDTVVGYAPMECIKNGYHEQLSKPYAEIPKSLTTYEDNDIVMAKVTPCFENGNIAIMTGTPSGIGFGSSELFVFRATAINTRFLFYWLQNWDFKSRAISTMTGVGGLKRVSPYFIKNSQLCFPSSEQQRQLVDYLDRKCAQIDAVITRQEAVIEKLKEYKLSLITEAVTKGLNPDAPMKDSGVEWIGQIPEHWSVIKGARIIISTQNGMTRRDMEKSEGELVLKLKNISSDGKIDYGFQNRIMLTDGEKQTYSLQEGDFLFVRVNGSRSLVGKCAIFHSIGETVAYNDHIIRVRISNLCQKEYFYWYLQGAPGKIEIDLHTITSAGQYTINSDGLRDIHLILPPEFEQKAIIEYLYHKCSQLDATIYKKGVLINRLTSYKKSLIYEVVTGKREVPA